MASNLSLISLLLFTFLLASTPLTSARKFPSSDITLVKDLEENYYIVKRKPAVLICQARNAADIIFTCAGTQIPPSSIEEDDMSDIDPSLIQAKIEVTRADIQNHGGQSNFWCECSALDVDGQIAVTSTRSFVSIPHMRHRFQAEPEPKTASEGENVEFVCGPPKANPKPEIMWRKDKKRLNFAANARFVVTDTGSLVIESVRAEDAGMYQCVAKNPAGRRESNEAQLTVSILAESAEPKMEVSQQAGVEGASEGKLRKPRQSKKVYFTSEPQPSYYIKKGEDLLIDCGVTGADILTYRCNTQRMERERQITNQGLDKEGNRVIQSQLNITYNDVEEFMLKHGNRKVYQCQCVAWYQDAAFERGWGNFPSDENVGKVYLAYLEDSFQKVPRDVIAGVNTDAVLKCEPPKGQPSPWIYYYKDRVRIDPRSESGKYHINEKGHLTIYNVQYEDSGFYNCLAENTVDSRQSPMARLTVTAEPPPTTTPVPSTVGAEEEEVYVPEFPAVIPDIPVFLHDLDSENVLGSDDSATLLCAVVSADQMTIDCGESRLEEGEYKKEMKNDRQSGKSLLSIQVKITKDRLARKPDNFFCECTAWYVADNKWEKVTSTKGYVKESSGPYIEDRFVYAPESVEAQVGEEVELACEPPKGDPKPQVYWLKDGDRIDSNNRNYIIEQGRLIVANAEVDDEAMYTCVAENEAGRRASTPVQLSVFGITTTRPATTPRQGRRTTAPPMTTEYYDYSDLDEPMFTEEPNPQNYVTKDKPVSLNCSVILTQRLMFACNDEVIRETASTGHVTKDPLTQLEIRFNEYTITKEMVESYTGSEPFSCTCRGYFQPENQQKLMFIESLPAVIEVAYLRSRFEKEPSDQEVEYLGSVSLKCKAPNGVPEPMIRWEKNGSPVVENERILVEDSGSLVIDGFDAHDEGEYVCIAKNIAKERMSQVAMVKMTGGEGEGGKPEPTPEPESTDSWGTGGTGTKDADGVPYISKDLHAKYYLIKNKPVTISCEAHGVQYITFSCGMEDVQPQIRERMIEIDVDGRMVMQNVVEASIEIRKQDLENYDGGKEYWCQCYAHYDVPGMADEQILTSEKGYVEPAYLKKNFQKEPENQRVDEGAFLSITCLPPVGNPEPKVSWTHDGEKVEALSITPQGGLIFPEARLEHTGEYVCIAENVAGTRSSPPILLEVIAGEGPVGPKSEKADKACMEMVSQCTGILPQNVPNDQYCEAQNDFYDCVDNFLEMCTGILNQESLHAVEETKMSVKMRCTMMPQCPKLGDCKMTFSNSPDSSMDTMGLPIRQFCGDISSFIRCVDQTMADCNVTMLPPEEGARASLFEVGDWFTQYCNRLILGAVGLDTCDEMTNCDLHIGQMAPDNATYWCRLVNSMVECTAGAVNTCNLDELRNDLEYLHAQASKYPCSPDTTSHEGGWPEVGPDPEGEIEIEGEPGQGEGQGEGSLGASSEGDGDDGNSSSTVGTSVFLATFTQLLVMAILSRR